jgi:MFS family permease
MLAVLLAGQFMGLLDVFVVNVALPAIGADLHASGASLQLVVGGYIVAYAMLLITGARLGDLYGRRRMYLVGVAVFTVSSLACGFAPDSGLLIGCRFAQGAGAAVMVPQIMSVIQMQFTGQARARALSAYGAVLSAGAVAGLVVGSVVVSADLFGATWRPVFLVNVPIGIGIGVLAPRLVPADAPRRASRRLDVAGLALGIPAVCLVVLPLVIGHEEGWPAWAYACIAAGAVFAGIFVRTERRIGARGGDPLVNFDVLRAAGVPSGLTTLACMQVAYGGFLFAFTLHLQTGLGDSALRAGLTYLPMGAAFGLVGYYWRKLPERIHPVVTPAGLALCSLAYVAVAAATRGGADGGALLQAGLVTLGAGMGLSVSPLLTQALVHVPPARVADASGLLTTVMQLGQVTGVAVLGTVFLTLRQHHGGYSTVARTSAHAMSATALLLALVSVIGVLAATMLARSVLRRPRHSAGPR